MLVEKARCYVGTSGWSYPHWRGLYYPEDLPNTRYLEYYARQFHCVEINSSFYRLPAEHILSRWYATVPDDFIFAAKASRYITHMKKLRDPRQTVQPFLKRISLLGEKLGPILFQLPPRWRFDGKRLALFLKTLSDEFRYAFELRDQSWLNDETYELLASSNAALCIYDLDGFVSPKRVTADLAYVRLHGPGGPYEGSYDSGALNDWAASFSAWKTHYQDMYCFFDNDQSGYASENAQRLQTILTARG